MQVKTLLAGVLMISVMFSGCFGSEKVPTEEPEIEPVLAHTVSLPLLTPESMCIMIDLL